MNNSLSEQVAELEADHARLGRKMFRLEAERNDLQRQVQEARDEAAELRAGQVQEARDQIATLRAGQGRWPKPDDFLCCGSQPTGYADDAQEENADLRAKLDRANDDMEGHLLADSIVDAENEVIAATTVPRLITADELREGQTVTASVDAMFRKPDDWEVFEVEKDSSGMYLSNTTIDMHASNADQIVLLADAPQPTGYADDDHQDAEITDWHDPAPQSAETMRALGDWIDRVNTALRPPRLTVHDLEVAPVGSVLRSGEFCFVKRKGGGWSIPEFINSSDPKETAEHLIRMGWDKATLMRNE